MTETSAPIQPIARPALAVELADRLREMILEGKLPEGEKIREKELTERFGVSRTPLREALKVLAAEGLLDLIPNRGAVISRQTQAELVEAFPVLAALEGLAGELAARHATEAEIARIAQLTSAMRTTHAEGDRPRYFELNQAIHAAILTAGRNDLLQRTHAAMAHRVHRARYQANLTPDRWGEALREHDRILNALQARDAETTGALLRRHMLNTLSGLESARQADSAG
jgi:DNA-binding GntR family transcriptional regulator